MAAKRAGVVTINLEAGTAKFLLDMDRANAKVTDFGRRVTEAGTHGVTGVQAVSGALRVMEGGITNNLRAAERFTANVLGLGPILQSVFPVIGAIAFLGILTKLGEELYKFFEGLREAPEKTANAFRELNAPIRLSNDELAVSNERLKISIATLEGHRSNTLALAIAQARVEADKLADSLDKDLQNLTKLMKENEVGSFKAFITGQAPTSKDTRSDEAIQKQLRVIDAEGTAAVAQAKTKEQAAQAQDVWNKKALAALDAEITKRKEALDLVERLQRIHENTATPAERQQYRRENPGVGGALVPLSATVPDQSAIVQERRESLTNLGYVRNRFSLSTENTGLSQKEEDLKSKAANAKLDRPFEDRMKALAAQMDGIKIEMQAIGQGDAAEILAKSFADSEKAIAEVNKALERVHGRLTANQEDQLRNRYFALASTEAESVWAKKVDATGDSIKDRIRQQQLLTEAVGQGYEATRKASVEVSVMGAVGAGKYQDEKWMLDHKDEIANLRRQFAAQFDAERGEVTAATVENLRKQIETEKMLTAAQALGADAVRQATLASKLREIELNGVRTATGELTDATKKQIAAETALFEQQRESMAAGELAKLTERIAEVKAETAAIVNGADAQRRAKENAAAAQTRRTLGPASGPVIAAQHTLSEAEDQQKITTEATKTGLAFENQMESLTKQMVALKSITVTDQNRVAIAMSMQDIQNAQLKAELDQLVTIKNLRDESFKLQAELSLQSGTATAGVKAFFLEMQEQAKQTSAIIEEALSSALDRTSENLAKLFTGQKTAWAKMFQSLGEETLTKTIKSALQTGLGKIGGAYTSKPDGSSQSSALWVRMAGGGAGAIPLAPAAPGTAAPGQGGGMTGGSSGVLGWLEKISGVRQGRVLSGNGGLLGTGGVPTVGTGNADGSPSNPVNVELSPNGSAPDGSEGNPLWVRLADGGFKSNPISMGPNQQQTENGPNGVQQAGSIIGDIAGAIGNLAKIPKRAAGGPVKKNKLHVVGEEGPELFIPPVDGQIVDHQTTKRMLANPSAPPPPASHRIEGRAAGGPVKKGVLHKVGEKGPELFIAPVDGHIVDHATSKRLLSDPATPAPRRIEARADGGDVSAGQAYQVGERGFETFSPNQFGSDQANRRGQGGGVAYYSIDARGTDPVLTEQRVRASLIAVHGSAVSTSLQVANERAHRTPQRS